MKVNKFLGKTGGGAKRNLDELIGRRGTQKEDLKGQNPMIFRDWAQNEEEHQPQASQSRKVWVVGAFRNKLETDA